MITFRESPEISVFKFHVANLPLFSYTEYIAGSVFSDH